VLQAYVNSPHADRGAFVEASISSIHLLHTNIRLIPVSQSSNKLSVHQWPGRSNARALSIGDANSRNTKKRLFEAPITPKGPIKFYPFIPQSMGLDMKDDNLTELFELNVDVSDVPTDRNFTPTLKIYWTLCRELILMVNEPYKL
jgi:hypothetical protein